MADVPTLWVLADHRAGNRNQALGVAEATGQSFAVKELRYGRLADLPGFMLGRTLRGLTPDTRRALQPPWPRAVIAAGRRAATVARAIKHQADGATALMQIMVPRGMPLDDFDLLVVPRHDKPSESPNVVPVIGAPHRITGTRLREAVETWDETFADLPRPLTVLLVGGSTRRRDFTPDMARDLGRRMNALGERMGGTLLVSTSPRTGAAVESALLAELHVPTQIHRYGDEGANPYLGYLALADFVVVTGDSVSMCCEACASPAPTYIYAPHDLVAPRHAALHAELYANGYARPLGETLEPWPHAPLNEAHRAARALLDLLGLERLA